MKKYSAIITCKKCGKNWDECTCPAMTELVINERVKEQLRSQGYEIDEG